MVVYQRLGGSMPSIALQSLVLSQAKEIIARFLLLVIAYHLIAPYYVLYLYYYNLVCQIKEFLILFQHVQYFFSIPQ